MGERINHRRSEEGRTGGIQGKKDDGMSKPMQGFRSFLHTVLASSERERERERETGALLRFSFFHAVFFDTHVLPMFVRRHMSFQCSSTTTTTTTTERERKRETERERETGSWAQGSATSIVHISTVWPILDLADFRFVARELGQFVRLVPRGAPSITGLTQRSAPSWARLRISGFNIYVHGVLRVE
jgi:hypothetical protein